MMTRLCRFCSHQAIGRVALSHGCVAYPEEREQDLCEHHLRRATPLGAMRLIADYTVDKELTKALAQGSL